MTNSYGVNPTLLNPENVQAQTDLRTDRGAARCCQFFSASLPPAWYFFTKGGKTFADNKLGLPGNWTSSITRLVSDVVIAPNGPKGFENIVIEMGVPLLYEFENDFKLIGSNGVFNLDPILEAITPSYLGQTFVHGGSVWIAGGTSSAAWVALSQSNPLLIVVQEGDYSQKLFILSGALPGSITLSVPEFYTEKGGSQREIDSTFVDFYLIHSATQADFATPYNLASGSYQYNFTTGNYQQQITVPFEANHYYAILVWSEFLQVEELTLLSFNESTNTLSIS